MGGGGGGVIHLIFFHSRSFHHALLLAYLSFTFFLTFLLILRREITSFISATLTSSLPIFGTEARGAHFLLFSN